MSEEERNLTPPEASGAPPEPPAPQQPEEVLSDKLAETADEVTSGLQDLLPDRMPDEPVEQVSVEPSAEPGPPEEQAVEPVAEEAGIVQPPPEPAPPEAQPVPPPSTEEPAAAELPPAPAAAETTKLVSATVAESTSDDRLMSMLAWLTMAILQLPIVSIIQLVSTSTKDRPFQRHHAITSLLFYVAGLAYEFVAVIVYTILGTITLGCGFACLWVIFFVPQAFALYFALQAYNGKLIELPVLSNFARQQKWL
jgi:uncharacterized membrane protein